MVAVQVLQLQKRPRTCSFLLLVFAAAKTGVSFVGEKLILPLQNCFSVSAATTVKLSLATTNVRFTATKPCRCRSRTVAVTAKEICQHAATDCHIQTASQQLWGSETPGAAREDGLCSVGELQANSLSLGKAGFKRITPGTELLYVLQDKEPP